MEKKMKSPDKISAHCARVRGMMSAYIDGDLSPVEGHQVSTHISTCVGCRIEERNFRSAMACLTSPKESVPHGDLYMRFEAQLARAMAPKWYQHQQLRWVGTAACLLLVIGVGASIVVRSLPHGPQHIIKTNTDLIVPQGNSPSIGRGVPVPLEPETSGNAGQPDIVAEPSVNDARGQMSNANSGRPLPTNGVDRGMVRNAAKSLPASNFWDVRDAQGMTARQKASNFKSADNSTGIPVPKNDNSNHVVYHIQREVHIPAAPRVTVLATEQSDQVEPGNKTTRVRTDTGYDSNGGLALIRIQSEPTKQENQAPN